MTTGDVVCSLRFSLIKILPEPGFDLGSTAGESCVLTARLHMLYAIFNFFSAALVQSNHIGPQERLLRTLSQFRLEINNQIYNNHYCVPYRYNTIIIYEVILDKNICRKISINEII